jgi:hypothetical protein
VREESRSVGSTRLVWMRGVRPARKDGQLPLPPMAVSPVSDAAERRTVEMADARESATQAQTPEHPTSVKAASRWRTQCSARSIQGGALGRRVRRRNARLVGERQETTERPEAAARARQRSPGPSRSSLAESGVEASAMVRSIVETGAGSPLVACSARSVPELRSRRHRPSSARGLPREGPLQDRP